MSTSEAKDKDVRLRVLTSWNIWGMPLFSDRLRERASSWRRGFDAQLSTWMTSLPASVGDGDLVVCCFQEAWAIRTGAGACCLFCAFRGGCCPCVPDSSYGAQWLTRRVRRQAAASDLEFCGWLCGLVTRCCCPWLRWDAKRFISTPVAAHSPSSSSDQAMEQAFLDSAGGDVHRGRTVNLSHTIGARGESQEAALHPRACLDIRYRLMDSGLVMVSKRLPALSTSKVLLTAHHTHTHFCVGSRGQQLSSHPPALSGFVPFDIVRSGDERMARKGVLWAAWRGALTDTVVLTTHMCGAAPEGTEEQQLTRIVEVVRMVTARLQHMPHPGSGGGAHSPAADAASTTARRTEVYMAGDWNLLTQDPRLQRFEQGLALSRAPIMTTTHAHVDKTLDHLFARAEGVKLDPWLPAMPCDERGAPLSDHLMVGAAVVRA